MRRGGFVTLASVNKCMHHNHTAVYTSASAASHLKDAKLILTTVDCEFRAWLSPASHS